MHGAEKCRCSKVKRSLQGQSFLVEDCFACDIRLLDHMSQVQIDACEDCTFVIGPVAGSIFIRDCSRCTFLVCGQQLRTRDCTDIKLLTHLVTQPIIEQTQQCSVAPWTVMYDNAAEHLAISGVTPDPTVWDNVYDFSPNWEPNAVHWTVMDSGEAKELEQQIIRSLPAEVSAAEVAAVPVPTAPTPAADAVADAERDENRIRHIQLSLNSSFSVQVSKVMNILRVDKAVCLVGKGMAITRATEVANGLCGTEITHMQTSLLRGQPRLEITVRMTED